LEGIIIDENILIFYKLLDKSQLVDVGYPCITSKIAPLWDNKIFKNKVNELLTSRKKDIENIYEDRNIITKDKYKYTFYFSIIIIAIIIIFGIIRLICYITGEERKIIGSYIYEKNKIALKKDGKCNIDDIIKKVTDCVWTYNKDDKICINIYFDKYVCLCWRYAIWTS